MIVPEYWKRENDAYGSSESIALPGYSAYLYVLDEESERRISFITPDGGSVVIRSKAPRFELIGTRLNDASETIGSLFCQQPPRICSLDDQGWSEIGTVVVGEEGTGRRRKWRTAFFSSPECSEQLLPSEVADRECGWYFLRFYDKRDELVESLDFRFVHPLQLIRMPQYGPLPPDDGHEPVHIELLHEAGFNIRPDDELGGISIQRDAHRTVLLIPPEPTCDRSRWLIGCKRGSQVILTMLVERVWWAIGIETNELSNWESQLIALPRESFAATSERALWLRFPRPRWVEKVLVGFEQARARAYPVSSMQQTVAIPLRDFCDSPEMTDLQQDHILQVWIERHGIACNGLVGLVSAFRPDWVGIGRKRSAVAVAMLRSGTGTLRVNGHLEEHYFQRSPFKARSFLRRLLELDQIQQTLLQMEVSIKVTGSSPDTSQQAKAATHALARALMSYNPALKPLLKQAGFGGVKLPKASCIQQEQ